MRIADSKGVPLKKIEELTLYSIEQNKKIEALEEKNKTLERKLEQIKKLEEEIKLIKSSLQNK